MPGGGSGAPKRRRLTRSGDFRRVFRDGSSKASRYLVLYSFPRKEGEESREDTRLGVSVSRKMGGAVDRNRVKRVLKEAFWNVAEHADPEHDFVLVARRDLGPVIEEEGVAGAERCVLELLDPKAEPGERST